jgi:hypothetical protein
MTARAEAVKILQPECRIYGTANRQTASLQFLRTKCMTIRSDLRIYFHAMPLHVTCHVAMQVVRSLPIRSRSLAMRTGKAYDTSTAARSDQRQRQQN